MMDKVTLNIFVNFLCTVLSSGTKRKVRLASLDLVASASQKPPNSTKNVL